MEPKGTDNRIKGLLIALLVSVVCFVGIVLYAYNWERIAQVDWKGKWNQTITKIQTVKETVFPEPEPLTVTFEVVKMSHDMPVITKKADGVPLIEVPLLSQQDCGYRTGCELVSATMVMNYYQSEVAAQDLYEVIAKVPSPIGEDGIGVSPNQCFIGNPVTNSGYGCYAEPIKESMNQLLTDGWHAVNVTGMDLSTVEELYLSQGTPVIIWATIHMMEPGVGKSWTLEDGTEFQWIAGEHCLVLVGADESYYYFNDPDHAGEVIGYERGLVEQRYTQLGKQAVVVSR